MLCVSPLQPAGQWDDLPKDAASAKREANYQCYLPMQKRLKMRSSKSSV
jgi:hypothetical protein